MCVDPVTMTALTVMSGVANVASQAQAAKAQAKAQQQASANEIKRWQQQVAAARLTEGHEETAAALEALKGDKEANEAIGTIITSGEERGIEGNATGLAVANYMQMNAEYQTALEQQSLMNRQGLSMRLTEAGMGFQQNMININQPIAGPDFLGVALGTARAAHSAYATGQLMEGQQNLYAQTAALRQAEAGVRSRGVSAAGITTGITRQGQIRQTLGAGARAAQP